MKKFTLCVVLGAVLVSCLGYTQTQGGGNQQKITESLSEYFKMDRLAFPNFHQQKVKVFLEGIDSEGHVISEIHLLNIN